MNKISYEERRKVYMKAIARSANTQIVVAIEEMSEVIKALTKFMRDPDNIDACLPGIIEEVADATIMLEQLRLIFGINEQVRAAMDAKVQRLKNRMEENDK